jgi:hypothetical protein
MEYPLTHSISQTKDLVTFLPLLAIVTLQLAIRSLDDFTGELDSHDRLGCLRRQRVLSLSLHNVHSIQSESPNLSSAKIVRSCMPSANANRRHVL